MALSRLPECLHAGMLDPDYGPATIMAHSGY